MLIYLLLTTCHLAPITGQRIISRFGAETKYLLQKATKIGFDCRRLHTSLFRSHREDPMVMFYSEKLIKNSNYDIFGKVNFNLLCFRDPNTDQGLVRDEEDVVNELSVERHDHDELDHDHDDEPVMKVIKKKPKVKHGAKHSLTTHGSTNLGNVTEDGDDEGSDDQVLKASADSLHDNQQTEDDLGDEYEVDDAIEYLMNKFVN